MSNVLYQCPKCRSRLFALAGGTRMRCPRDDVRYEQVEEAPGTDYLFKDEKGEVHRPNPDEHAAATLPEKELREYLRGRYNQLTGNVADGRWSNDTLLEEVQKALPPLAIDTTETMQKE